jgi:hypothetical protein
MEAGRQFAYRRLRELRNWLRAAVRMARAKKAPIVVAS